MGTRKAVKANKATRKHRASDVVTVDSLHASFDKMNRKIRALVERGATDADLAASIRHNWSVQFHNSLSAVALKGLVSHYRALYKSSKRYTRKQRGGSAPIAMQLGEGNTQFLHGRFPDPMSSQPILRDLDLGRSMVPGTDNTCMKGGGVLDSVMQGHFLGGVPRPFLETAGSAMQGHMIANPPSDPMVHTWSMDAPGPKALDTTTMSSLSAYQPVY
jgi:hypothetical protein